MHMKATERIVSIEISSGRPIEGACKGGEEATVDWLGEMA